MNQKESQSVLTNHSLKIGFNKIILLYSIFLIFYVIIQLVKFIKGGMRMNDLMNYDIYIFDYEGTLSQSPSTKLTLKELLYEFDFRKLSPNEKIFNFINSIGHKTIYVVGIIESNKEIEQKNEWLKKHYPMIEKENYIFISSDYKKSEAIQEIINKYRYDKSKILFIDDKNSHIKDVSELGIKSILVEDLIY